MLPDPPPISEEILRFYARPAGVVPFENWLCEIGADNTAKLAVSCCLKFRPAKGIQEWISIGLDALAAPKERRNLREPLREELASAFESQNYTFVLGYSETDSYLRAVENVPRVFTEVKFPKVYRQILFYLNDSFRFGMPPSGLAELNELHWELSSQVY